MRHSGSSCVVTSVPSFATLPDGARSRARRGSRAGNVHQSAERHQIVPARVQVLVLDFKIANNAPSIICAAEHRYAVAGRRPAAETPSRCAPRLCSSATAPKARSTRSQAVSSAPRSSGPSPGSARVRSCILLRHVEGYSYEEIAETLGSAAGTVKRISTAPVMNYVVISKIAATETRP